MRLFRPSIIALNALIFGTLLSAWPSMAQAQLTLLINQGQVQGRFLIDGDVTYATGTGVVSMDVSLNNQEADARNPLICFDFSSEEPGVALRISTDSYDVTSETIVFQDNFSSTEQNSRVLIDGLGLTSALQYQLGTKTIEITPSSNVACFFKAYNAADQTYNEEFGLYGQGPSSSAQAGLDVSLTTPSSTNNPNVVSYEIIARNTSADSINSLALQQTVPFGLDIRVADCKLIDGPAQSACVMERPDPLHFPDFSLASGARLELKVTASRNSNWPPDGPSSLPIFIAIASRTSAGMIFDVDEITVVFPQ